MGKIVFFSTLSFSVIFALWCLSKLNTKDEKNEKRSMLKLSLPNDVGIFMIPGIILLFLGSIYWWLIRFNSNHQYTPAVIERIKTVRIKQVQQVPQKQQRQEHGTLTWEKPEDFERGISQKRRDSFEVVVNIDGGVIVSFIASYYTADGMPQKAQFWVNRRVGQRIEGTWSQKNPSGSGSWHLEPVDNNPRVLRGEVSNQDDIHVLMRLELGDTG